MHFVHLVRWQKSSRIDSLYEVDMTGIAMAKGTVTVGPISGMIFVFSAATSPGSP